MNFIILYFQKLKISHILYKRKNFKTKILIFINIILFLINIKFLLKKNVKIVFIDKTSFKFKISDYFNIALLNQTYQQISYYLNKKFDNNYLTWNFNLFKIKKTKNYKKKIKLHCTDLFSEKNHKLWIKDKLQDKFDIHFDQNNPDYLIFNVFGQNHLNSKYKNAIKIAIYTENKIPDLNEVDYAIGHAHINYLDRYFKHSILLWKNYKNISEVRKNVLNSPFRTKFCSALISNSISTDFFRLKFINELNKYKKVDMGGLYNNNIGKRIDNKKEYLSSYKFSIAMENSNGDGYVSEKIIDSFISGTIPIYYGDYMIDEYINPKSFILIKGEKDIKEKINLIKLIDNDDEKYRNILKENVIIDNNFSHKIDKELRLFLSHIFEQDKSKAYRIDN